MSATINGYGERCGNANMVSILANLALKTPNELSPVGGGDLAALTELSRSVAEIANVTLNDYQPYVGLLAFAHKGGVQAAWRWRRSSALRARGPDRRRQRGPAGRRPEPGRQGEHRDPGPPAGSRACGHRGPEGAQPDHQAVEERGPGLRGRRGVLRAADPPPGEGLRGAVPDLRTTRASWSSGPGRSSCAEATVKVEVAGEILHTAADGNGPVNALDGALRSSAALDPVLDTVHLVDYKVRILRRGHRDRRPDPGHHRLAGRLAHLEAPRAATRTSSRRRRRRWRTRSSTRIWKSGAELRRRDERHFTTTNGGPTANGGPAAAEAGGPA